MLQLLLLYATHAFAVCTVVLLSIHRHVLIACNINLLCRCIQSLRAYDTAGRCVYIHCLVLRTCVIQYRAIRITNNNLLAMYCSHTLQSTFLQNRADTSFGGALWIVSDNAITIGTCQFSQNSGYNGGALMLTTSDETATLSAVFTITKSIFDRNSAAVSGASILLAYSGRAIITDTVFRDHTAISPIFTNIAMVLSRCLFDNNSGGGIQVVNAVPLYALASNWTNNYAVGYSAAISSVAGLQLTQVIELYCSCFETCTQQHSLHNTVALLVAVALMLNTMLYSHSCQRYV
jgi:hypothetical protein